MCYKLGIGVNNTSIPCRVLCSNSLRYPYSYGLLPTENYTRTIWATLHIWGIMLKLYKEPCTYGLFLTGHYTRHLAYPCTYKLLPMWHYVGTLWGILAPRGYSLRGIVLEPTSCLEDYVISWTFN